MRTIHPKQAHGLRTGADSYEDDRENNRDLAVGMLDEAAGNTSSANHFAGLGAYPAGIRDEIARWGLTRVAGNVFQCDSTRDFWAVKGGKIMKLTGNEVDAGESIPGAPEDRPAAFLAGVLDDLSFD